MPMRSIGVKWLAVDPEAQKLSVSLDLPEQAEPRGAFTIPVTLAGLTPGEAAFVSVSAVDVGILNLTRHEVADPEAWYFGQRALGLEIRDLYGRLIDGSAERYRPDTFRRRRSNDAIGRQSAARKAGGVF